MIREWGLVPYELESYSVSVATCVSVSSGHSGCVSFSGLSAESCSSSVPITATWSIARLLASTLATVRYSPGSVRNSLHRWMRRSWFASSHCCWSSCCRSWVTVVRPLWGLLFGLLLRLRSEGLGGAALLVSASVKSRRSVARVAATVAAVAAASFALAALDAAACTAMVASNALAATDSAASAASRAISSDISSVMRLPFLL
jgi:hypothetical protein